MFAGFASANAIRAEGARVFVNEVAVLQLRSSNGGLGPAQRAAVVVNNLAAHGASGVWVKRSGRNYALLVGQSPVLYVTPAEAKAAGSTASALAKSWAARINAAGALPAIKLEKTQFTLPPGQAHSLDAVGSEARESLASTDNSDVVQVEKRNAKVILRTVGLGEATVTVAGATGSVAIRVKVLPNAASLPQTVSATVTGPIVDADVVRSAAEGALRTQLVTQSGASIRFALPKEIGNLPAMQTRTYRVPVKASAPNAFDVEGWANVVVRNASLDFVRESELWYCNYPENVTSPGTLFTARLRANAPARMLYHHINQSPANLTLHVLVVNDSDSPAKLVLIPGDGDPDKNPVKAGYDAGDMFVRGWVQNTGEVLNVPPRSAVPVSLRRLRPLETASGLCYLRLLAGGPESLLVRTDARPDFVPDSRLARALRSATPWREVSARSATEREQSEGVLSEHVYPEPFKEYEQVDFSVTDLFRALAIGEKPIQNGSGAKRLDGNFGVIYTFRLNLFNPTDRAANVEIVFESSAGYTGGLFLINEKYKKTPLLQPRQRFELERVALEPGQSRRVVIRTVPLSGASYPARIFVAQAGYSRSLGSGDAIGGR